MDIQPLRDADFGELDLTLFLERYLSAAVSAEVLVGNQREPEVQMASLWLIDLSPPAVPIVLGILAIGRQPSRHLPMVYVSFLRLAGTHLASAVITSHDIVRGHPPQCKMQARTYTMNQDTRLDPRTLAAQALGLEDPLTGAVVPPLYLSTTYTRDEDYAPRASGVYIRDASPTVAHAEAVIAALEQGAAALCFGSGMAACTAPLHALAAGDHVVCGRTVYHGVIEWLERFAAARGIRYDWFETGDLDTLQAAIRPETRLVWLETPANPTWAITDIAAASVIAHAAGARVAVDSTCATPVLTRPLELGADLVCHAATKYLGGHSDLLAGALITREADDFWQRIADHRRLGGAMLGAMDAYLLIRGLRTLYLRVERQCANAQAVAEFLAGHAAVERVLYPGLAEHPGHAVAARQMQGGFGGMLSFQPRGDAQAAIDVVRCCRVWKPATSLGGTESLIEHRRSSEGDIRTTTPDNLIRLSTGIEAAADLIGDLEQALAG